MVGSPEKGFSVEAFERDLEWQLLFSPAGTKIVVITRILVVYGPLAREEPRELLDCHDRAILKMRLVHPEASRANQNYRADRLLPQERMREGSASLEASRRFCHIDAEKAPGTLEKLSSYCCQTSEPPRVLVLSVPPCPGLLRPEQRANKECTKLRNETGYAQDHPYSGFACPFPCSVKA
nr:hypothetical protein Iba_chr01dCG5950 [Ipomoea batatas]